MPRIIAVDFDGTLCEDRWPEIGRANEPVLSRLRRAKTLGRAKIILWTCRAGKELTEAVEWCAARGIIFDAVNENLPEIRETFGKDTRKIYADEYWDDRARHISFEEVVK